MRRLGSLLMAFGLLLGTVLAISLAVGIQVGGVPLLAAIGLGKLSFLIAAGFMGVGAAARRLGIRQEHRRIDSLMRPDKGVEAGGTPTR